MPLTHPDARFATVERAMRWGGRGKGRTSIRYASTQPPFLPAWVLSPVHPTLEHCKWQFHYPTYNRSLACKQAAYLSNLGNVERSQIGPGQNRCGISETNHTHRKALFSRQTILCKNNFKFSLTRCTTKKTLSPTKHPRNLSCFWEGRGECREGGETLYTHQVPATEQTLYSVLVSANPGTSPGRKILWSSLFYKWGEWRKMITRTWNLFKLEEPGRCRAWVHTAEQSAFGYSPPSTWWSSFLRGFAGHRGKFKEIEQTQCLPFMPTTDQQGKWHTGMWYWLTFSRSWEHFPLISL